MKLRVLSLFSGIGAFEMALRNIEIDYELVNFCENDKYAIKAYCAIHDVDENLNLGDITKVSIENLPKDIDLITHGSPCQDFSVAGLQRGGDEGSKTRSSLMWNTVEIIKHCKPKYVIWENVKNVLSKKHKHNFDKYLKTLELLGYTNYWKVLNAKDYGVPQNRERVFVVSILGEHESYKFADKIPLDKCIADILEDKVDEKYYLSEEIQKRFKLTNQNKNIIGTTKPDFRTIGQRDVVYDKNGIMGALVATDYKQPKQILDFVGGIGDKDWVGDNKKLSRNYPQGNRVYSSEGIACSQTSNGGGLGGPTGLYLTDYRIRKLTPRECFRLMGMKDDDIDKIQAAGISNTQQYKMAGNSIVVDVLEAIFKNLFMEG